MEEMDATGCPLPAGRPALPARSTPTHTPFLLSVLLATPTLKHQSAPGGHRKFARTTRWPRHTPGARACFGRKCVNTCSHDLRVPILVRPREFRSARARAPRAARAQHRAGAARVGWRAGPLEGCLRSQSVRTRDWYTSRLPGKLNFGFFGLQRGHSLTAKPALALC